MFNFRIIDCADGTQVIDDTLKTPYSSLTALQMEEYIEVDNSLDYEKRMERKQRKEAERKQKILKKCLRKLASVCGIM